MASPLVDTPEHPAWQVHLLGGLRILRGGLPVASPPFRAQALLAWLLLHPTPQKREGIAGGLFPDSPGEAAKARISDCLWLVRKHLPGFPLCATPGEIGFDATQVQLDVDEFRRLARQGDPASLACAIDLYRGDLLPEQDLDWLLLERENLYLAYVRALQTLGTHLLQNGEPRQAVPLLEKLNQIEPFDEYHLRGLLRAHQTSGGRGAALAAFDRFRIHLKEEMGLDPEPATLELVQAIRAQAAPPPPSHADLSLPTSLRDLFQRGQASLWRGDFRSLQACIESLRKKSAGIEADGLEAASAILRGDFACAKKILARHVPPPMLIHVQQIHLSVELREFSHVVERCKAAILEAHRQKDLGTELLLLADQGSACQRTGQPLEAMRCANQVITQAEKENLPYFMARGLLLKGILQISQGFERDALETFHHAATYAGEHGFLPLLSRVEGKLGIAYQQAGKYRLSIQHHERALQIARDLNMKRDEAETLHNLAVALASLGRNDESIHYIRQGRDLFATLNDEQGMARNTYHLAFGLALAEGTDLGEALSLGHQALEIFEKHQSQGWMASVYAMLGYIHWLRSEPDAAIAMCGQALPIYQQLEEADFIPELYGYIGLAHLQKGDPQQALTFTTAAMDEMMRSELYDIASEIYYAHASALDSLGRQDEAEDYFQRGYKNLLNYAAEIEDPEALDAYFRRDPTVRRLMEQVYARGLAPRPRVETRLVPAPGRPSVPISLTVDAGAADVALKNAAGAVQLRRARLLRILREARAQGRDPSLAQIAEMMNVSLRTLQRDVGRLEES
ncbi:MAG: tetratricopeptide repeat protein [Chloroflexi bacterium]|nr:tetratricopeptide repeat protein [Chloroflexota bacterium]